LPEGQCSSERGGNRELSISFLHYRALAQHSIIPALFSFPFRPNPRSLESVGWVGESERKTEQE
jgi:hypothetical protein